MSSSEIAIFLQEKIVPFVIIAASMMLGLLTVLIPLFKRFKELKATLKGEQVVRNEQQLAFEAKTQVIIDNFSTKINAMIKSEADKLQLTNEAVEAILGFTQDMKKYATVLNKLDLKYDTTCLNCPVAIANKVAEEVKAINDENK